MQYLQPNTTLQGGKYRIERVLGQGGFGITYLARNTVFDVNVAIKEFFMKDENSRDGTIVTMPNSTKSELFQGQKEKFKKEARRMFAIRNEHIIGVHDLFEENGTAYYVMDYVDGENLSERLKRTGQPMTDAEVKEILPQILDALKAIHQNEIWHLDLKPGNIMTDKYGMAFLIDFGASKQIRTNGSMTTSTALCYTPGYAPNEQIGQMYDRFGPWTDIYALGATIYNLLTSKEPPKALDIEEDEEDAFSFPHTVSENMRKLVIWMMQPQRKARPQAIDEIYTELDTQGNDNQQQMINPELNGDETIIIYSSNNPSNKKENLPVIIETNDKNDKQEESRTILVISKKENSDEYNPAPLGSLLQRAIKVGDFIFEDGTYSDIIENDKKKVIGTLFSYYGGAHGQILSTVKPDDNLSINGKELRWHEASIAEWVEVIQNLGHCKVSYGNGEYKFFSDQVKEELKKSLIKEPRYITRKSISGVAYIINIKRSIMVPLMEDTGFPYIYISEF